MKGFNLTPGLTGFWQICQDHCFTIISNHNTRMCFNEILIRSKISLDEHNLQGFHYESTSRILRSSSKKQYQTENLPFITIKCKKTRL